MLLSRSLIFPLFLKTGMEFLFNEADLLNRYPEVKNVVNKHPEWLQGGYRLNKIFFACHAVSLYSRNR